MATMLRVGYEGHIVHLSSYQVRALCTVHHFGKVHHRKKYGLPKATLESLRDLGVLEKSSDYNKEYALTDNGKPFASEVYKTIRAQITQESELRTFDKLSIIPYHMMQHT